MSAYYLEILILSIIQGISEFIPVSSSAHLLLFSKIKNLSYTSLEIDISLHLGSLIAIIIYFWKDLFNIFKNKDLLKLIFFGSTPLIICGFFFYKLGFIDQVRNLKVIAWTTLIFGILLFFADKKIQNKNIVKDLNLKNIFLIGLFQILSLIPGVSRSGIIITACRFSNFNRIDAAKISFFLSIPALAGASALGLSNIEDKSLEINLVICLSILFSFIFSYMTIKFLLYYLKRFSLNVFVYYRLILSLLLFIIAYN
ncbi:MAG: undecaprenyl-diphosphate phosphatase [Candidatus Pelagibacter sp. TMED118]|nr:MAG: undecaprenyl-diphosphate phosphatase [Candidatus Pelagibacter sp. TMED118]|tara:strand:- start:9096 stop:9863 length:768 start_codon:yes stop_codon:yes gene_type:complete